MSFSGKKKEATEVGESRLPRALSFVLPQKKEGKLVAWSLRFLCVMAFVALFGDFMANEKPLWCKLEGKHYFPVLKQYAVDLGVAKWDARFLEKSWSEHTFDAVIFPPIPYSASTIDLKNSSYKSPFGKQQVPGIRLRHWLGTDRLGHDVAAGLIAGTRVALLVGLVAMSIATAIGVFLGAIAGYFGDDRFRVARLRFWLNLLALFPAVFYGFCVPEIGGSSEQSLLKGLFTFLAIMAAANLLASGLGKIIARQTTFTLPLDLIVMRGVEVLNAIPGLLLLLSLVAVLQKSSILNVVIAIGLIRWTGICRYMRAELLKVKTAGYVEAARAMGFSDRRILLRHALPNAMTPVLITVAFGAASAILLESTLSFLGIGVADGSMTWGRLLAEARQYPGAWWLAVFPGMAIFITVTSLNVLGEHFSEAK
jgi:peptide/nickel transport system permease protein